MLMSISLFPVRGAASSVAALIAWFILGEQMGPAEAFGAALIVAGVLISQIKLPARARN